LIKNIIIIIIIGISICGIFIWSLVSWCWAILYLRSEYGHSYNDTQGSNHAPLGFFYLVDGCVSIALDITGAYCILFY